MKIKAVWGVLASAAISALSGSSVYAEGNSQAGKTKFEACSGCHSHPGYANVFPRYLIPKLSGQHAPYVVSALKAYAGADRRHSTMQGNAESLTPQDSEDIAAYIGSFKLVSNDDSVTGDIKAGKKKSGSCAACHGKAGDSSDANFPRLAGQYESYLVKAIEDYQTGKRNNAMMNNMVTNLSEEDIVDIASYYASQPKGLGVVER